MPTTLAYAEPSTPRKRGMPASVMIALAAFALTIFGFIFIGPYYGSGIIRPNPFSLLPAGGVWLLGILYVWKRIEEDPRSPSFAMGLFGFGATLAIVVVPVHVWVLREDPGVPQSRWRVELTWPAAITLVALLLAAAGNAMANWRGAPQRFLPLPGMTGRGERSR